MKEENGHADKDQRERLCQCLHATFYAVSEERAHKADHPPEDYFKTNEGYSVKIKSSNGFHFLLLLSLQTNVVARRAFALPDAVS